jgi:hypothetical protein
MISCRAEAVDNRIGMQQSISLVRSGPRYRLGASRLDQQSVDVAERECVHATGIILSCSLYVE